MLTMWYVSYHMIVRVLVRIWKMFFPPLQYKGNTFNDLMIQWKNGYFFDQLWYNKKVAWLRGLRHLTKDQVFMGSNPIATIFVHWRINSINWIKSQASLKNWIEKFHNSKLSKLLPNISKHGFLSFSTENKIVYCSDLNFRS